MASLNNLRRMTETLRMKCSSCGHWNRVSVNKIFIEQNSPEPKVKVFNPMYKLLEVTKCEKCGKVIAEPKELIRITKGIEKVKEIGKRCS